MEVKRTPNFTPYNLFEPPKHTIKNPTYPPAAKLTLNLKTQKSLDPTTMHTPYNNHFMIKENPN